MPSPASLIARAQHCWRQRDHRAAQTAFRQAIQAAPANPEAHFQLGTLLCELGQLPAGIASLTRAAQLAPARADILINLGAAYQRAGQLDPAGEAFAAARARLAAPSAELAYNLGIVRQQQGRLSEAIDAFGAAVAVAPTWSAAWTSLGHNLMTTGQAVAAQPAYARALSLAPSDAAAWSNWCWASNYDEAVGDAELGARHHDFGARLKTLRAEAAATSTPVRAIDPARRPLTIGWLSPNLTDHAVAYFIAPLFRHYDRQRWRCIAYHLGRTDPVTQRLTAPLDGHRDLHGASDATLRDRIAADEVDILIDLAGHTAHNRLGALIPRVAPVQVSYLGYPTTTGLDAIDALISDSRLDPGDGFAYTERLLRLPLFCCYAPPADAPEPGPLPALRNGHLRFGSFQNFAKLSPPTLKRWCRLLRALPTAQLLIQGGGGCDGPTRERLQQHFVGAGIAAERIRVEPFAGFAAYLAAHREIDICLDTTPWNGHTTTCHALWMGVPTLSRATGRRAGRMGFAVMAALGLADRLVADDDDAFVALGEALAADLPALADLRANLRPRVAASLLTDGPAHAAAFADALDALITNR